MSAHGRNENVEKSRSGKYTFLPVFSHFPRMHSIRPAVFHTAQPVGGRQWLIQLAKKQSPSAKGFLRGPQCGHPIRKVSIVHLRKIVCVVLCFTGKLYERYSLLHPETGPGHCPGPEKGAGTMSLLGVEGAKPRTSPQAPPGNCLFDANCQFWKWVQGTALVRKWNQEQCPLPHSVRKAISFSAICICSSPPRPWCSVG